MSGIVIKSPREVEGIRRAGEILRETLELAQEKIERGMTTGELDRLIEEFILSRSAIPVFKGYRGFPASSCISVNDQVIHGIPGKLVIRHGDLVKIDVGVKKDGFVADAARSVPVGEVSEEVMRLVAVTKQALANAISEAKTGNRVGDISHAIEETARNAGFEVVREYFGHGTGLDLHEEPNVPNYGPKGVGPLLEQGMTIAIEPMLAIGSGKVKLAQDNWTVLTADGSCSAHFEHTIVVTANGAEVLA